MSYIYTLCQNIVTSILFNMENYQHFKILIPVGGEGGGGGEEEGGRRGDMRISMLCMNT